MGVHRITQHIHFGLHPCPSGDIAPYGRNVVYVGIVSRYRNITKVNNSPNQPKGQGRKNYSQTINRKYKLFFLNYKVFEGMEF